MKLVIDRKIWLRGEGSGESVLHRRNDGKMCCLGILGQACGQPVASMSGVSSPFIMQDKLSVYGLVPSYSKVLQIDRNRRLLGDLMNLNDDTGFTEAERERQVAEELLKLGVEVEFIN